MNILDNELTWLTDKVVNTIKENYYLFQCLTIMLSDKNFDEQLTSKSIVSFCNQLDSKFPYTSSEVGIVLRSVGIGPTKRQRNKGTDDSTHVNVWDTESARKVCDFVCMHSRLFDGTTDNSSALKNNNKKIEKEEEEVLLYKPLENNLPHNLSLKLLTNKYLSILLPKHDSSELYYLSTIYNDKYYDYEFLIELRRRILSFSILVPSTGCLVLPENICSIKYDKAGYGVVNKTFFNELQNLAPGPICYQDENENVWEYEYDQLPAKNPHRLVAMATYPNAMWVDLAQRPDPASKEAEYEKWQDVWRVHHICRNPACVNPFHLQPMRDSTHKTLHRVLGETSHPSLTDVEYEVF